LTNTTGRSKRGYAKVNIPKQLAELIDEVIKDGKYGYRSRDEFVTDAVRRRLEELGYLKP